MMTTPCCIHHQLFLDPTTKLDRYLPVVRLLLRTHLDQTDLAASADLADDRMTPFVQISDTRQPTEISLATTRTRSHYGSTHRPVMTQAFEPARPAEDVRHRKKAQTAPKVRSSKVKLLPRSGPKASTTVSKMSNSKKRATTKATKQTRTREVEIRASKPSLRTSSHSRSRKIGCHETAKAACSADWLQCVCGTKLEPRNPEQGVGCENCDRWFHSTCIG